MLTVFLVWMRRGSDTTATKRMTSIHRPTALDQSLAIDEVEYSLQLFVRKVTSPFLCPRRH